MFGVNARGVQRDGRFSRSGEIFDVNWNAVWDSAVTKTDYGWSAELRIPFTQLRYVSEASEFGVQFARYLAKESEWSHFSPLPKSAARPLLHLARLTQLEDLPTSGGLALRPYGLFRFQESSEASLWEPQVGGDLLYQPTGSTTVHATFRPDFGQVEQDPSQLNLTAFEIYQTERRQFFLDGQENFLTPLAPAAGSQDQLYYSRRIGARPTTDFGLDDAGPTSYPGQTTILGAAKVLSRTNRGLSANLLTAFTERETAEFSTNGALERRTVASPSSYNVGRIAQQVQGGKGALGVSGTHVERFLDEGLVSEQTRRASSGATDFDLRFGDIGLKGQVAATHIEGSAEAIDIVQRSSTNNLHRVDAEYLDYDPERTHLTGYSAHLEGGKYDGSPWRASWGGRIRSPGFNPNDMGFLRLAVQEVWNMFVQYRFDEPNSVFRRASIDGNAWFEKSWGPEVTAAGAATHSHFQFDNNYSAWFGGLRRVENVDTRLLRGGPAMRLPGGTGWWMGVHSDPRKSADLQLQFNGDLMNQDSFRRLHFLVQGFFRPTSSLDVAVSPSFESKLDDRQYVDTRSEGGQDVYYLGRLNQETYSLTLRASWAMALGLTLRVYAMPFVSAGRYEHFYRVTDPRADAYRERRTRTQYDGDASFLSTQARSTVVLRWDFLPGSSAYAVWTHEQNGWRTDTGSVSPGRDARDLLRAGATDVIMLKWSYFVPVGDGGG